MACDIYAKNLTTNETIQVTSSGTAGTADIYGDTIVFSDKRNGDYDLFIYDLSTRTESLLYAAPGDQIYPAIHAGDVVFISGQEIWMYSTGQAKPVCTVPGYKWRPDISATLRVVNINPAARRAVGKSRQVGGLIVWGDYRNGNWDIYGSLSDISNEPVGSTEFVIANGSAYQRSVAVSGTTVVYEETTTPTGPAKIGVYNHATKQTRYIETAGAVDWLDIDGDVVVWGQYGKYGTDICAYNLADRTNIYLPKAGTWQYSPAIYYDTIVFSSDQPGGAGFHDRDIDAYKLNININRPPIITGAVPKGH